MTEQRKPKRFIVRRLVVAALVLALAAALAMGANAATNGEFFNHVVTFVTTTVDGEMEIEVTADLGAITEDGMVFTVRDTGDGRKSYITYRDKNGNIITEEMDMDKEITIEKDGAVYGGGAGQDSAASQPNVEAESAQRAASNAG